MTMPKTSKRPTPQQQISNKPISTSAHQHIEPSSTHRRRAICRRCDGTGQVEHTNYPDDGYTAHQCPVCKGSGMVQLTIKVFVEPATVSAI